MLSIKELDDLLIKMIDLRASGKFQNLEELETWNIAIKVIGKYRDLINCGLEGANADIPHDDYH